MTEAMKQLMAFGFSVYITPPIMMFDEDTNRWHLHVHIFQL